MNQRNEIRADVNMTIKSMELTETDFGGACINEDYVKVSYARTGNILIGMLHVTNGYTYGVE